MAKPGKGENKTRAAKGLSGVTRRDNVAKRDNKFSAYSTATKIKARHAANKKAASYSD